MFVSLQCAVLLEWIDTNKSQVAEHDFETQYKVVTGPEFVMFLAEKGIIAANLHTMKVCYIVINRCGLQHTYIFCDWLT